MLRRSAIHRGTVTATSGGSVPCVTARSSSTTIASRGGQRPHGRVDEDHEQKRAGELPHTRECADGQTTGSSADIIGRVARVIPLVPAQPQPPASAKATAGPPKLREGGKPEWLKVRAPGSPTYLRLKGIMRELKLHTVCEEAQCPNIGECWHHGTATFMILGDVCTRACAYCAVVHGRPGALDPDEPTRVADAISQLALNYV